MASAIGLAMGIINTGSRGIRGIRTNHTPPACAVLILTAGKVLSAIG